MKIQAYGYKGKQGRQTATPGSSSRCSNDWTGTLCPRAPKPKEKRCNNKVKFQFMTHVMIICIQAFAMMHYFNHAETLLHSQLLTFEKPTGPPKRDVLNNKIYLLPPHSQQLISIPIYPSIPCTTLYNAYQNNLLPHTHSSSFQYQYTHPFRAPHSRMHIRTTRTTNVFSNSTGK